jgi:hypothetical protein
MAEGRGGEKETYREQFIKKEWNVNWHRDGFQEV